MGALSSYDSIFPNAQSTLSISPKGSRNLALGACGGMVRSRVAFLTLATAMISRPFRRKVRYLSVSLVGFLIGECGPLSGFIGRVGHYLSLHVATQVWVYLILDPRRDLSMRQQLQRSRAEIDSRMTMKLATSQRRRSTRR
ncbi:hypothetical protein BJ322DRAFT_92205 [Thelephora terrestris]|uniref:Uncharacterized protein n=1 Tax=Thelephora terrestris TaxID=56493 RepID=A0A9P6LCP7_9AGAM|nr:hypothetical protein BJ322DRAFT_92205 [Thelephora terrestris]